MTSHDISVYRLTNLQSRAATAENPTAEPGRGGMTGGGLKGSPAIKDFRAGSTEVLLDTRGPGMIRHIWCTSHGRAPADLRNQILRIYWEGSDVPSVEAPLGDFFGAAHGAPAPMYSQMISLQEGRGCNCYFPMPFSHRTRITISNETDRHVDWFFYQIDFTLGDEVTDDDGRFHARFRRENPCPLGDDYTILETAGGRGVYMGCVMGVRPLTPGWWGEGEVKMYLDGDDEFPTICGTGTEGLHRLRLGAWRPQHPVPGRAAGNAGIHHALPTPRPRSRVFPGEYPRRPPTDGRGDEGQGAAYLWRRADLRIQEPPASRSGRRVLPSQRRLVFHGVLVPVASCRRGPIPRA